VTSCCRKSAFVITRNHNGDKLLRIATVLLPLSADPMRRCARHFTLTTPIFVCYLKPLFIVDTAHFRVSAPSIE